MLDRLGRLRSGTVTITPEETDEILANPGMGWETFHKTAERGQEPACVDSIHHPLRTVGLEGTWSPRRARSITTFWTAF